MWQNVYTFTPMKAEEPRKVRGYKIVDKAYMKALKRGQKENTPLATLLEKVVELYAAGWTLAIYDTAPEFASKINLND